MKNETLIIGDLHGKIDVLKEAVKLDKHIISLGDILDSFNRPPKDQIDCINLLCDLIEDGKARAIFGNHEFSYIRNDLRCSGHNFLTDTLFLSVRERVFKNFEHFIWLPKIKTLITHAGIDKKHWDDNLITVDNIVDELETAVRIKNSWFWNIGYFRGGISDKGGPLWLDWDKEFTPAPEIRQIVGHTAFHQKTKLFREGWGFLGRSFIQTSPNGDLNIDVLDTAKQILNLDLDTGEVEVITL